MVELKVKNTSELDKKFHIEIEEFCNHKVEYFNELFKNYSKNLTLEVIFDHSSALYKISAAIDLKSKKVLSVEEGKELMHTLDTLCNKFKKAVKKQYELEKKNYEYKRKR